MERILVDRTHGVIPVINVTFPAAGEPPIIRVVASPPENAMADGAMAGGGFSCEYAQALQAALGENVERNCCSIRSDAQLIFGDYQELSRYSDLVHPNECQTYRPEQYAKLHYRPFHVDTAVSWTWAYSLIQLRPVLVPAAFVFQRFPRRSNEPYIGQATSSGAACATSVCSATLKGILEIIERDAFVITWLNKLECPRVVIDGRTEFGRRLERIRGGSHFKHTLLLISTNLTGVHVFLAICQEKDGGILRSYVGAAAHPDPLQAAIKATVETHQARLWTRQVARNNAIPALDTEITSLEQHGLIYSETDRSACLDFLLSSSAELPLESLDDGGRVSCGISLSRCLGVCARLGIDVIAADVTSEDVREAGLRVVKVVMPSMVPIYWDHANPPLAVRRLFDVPVLLGWREKPIAVDELNPDPHPFA